MFKKNNKRKKNKELKLFSLAIPFPVNIDIMSAFKDVFNVKKEIIIDEAEETEALNLVDEYTQADYKKLSDKDKLKFIQHILKNKPYLKEYNKNVKEAQKASLKTYKQIQKKAKEDSEEGRASKHLLQVFHGEVALKKSKTFIEKLFS